MENNPQNQNINFWHVSKNVIIIKKERHEKNLKEMVKDMQFQTLLLLMNSHILIFFLIE